MKKSGFEEFEIREYREGKKQWSNEVERDALKKMEIASEKVAKEYKELVVVLTSNSGIGETIQVLKLHNISNKEYKRLLSLMRKQGGI